MSLPFLRQGFWRCLFIICKQNEPQRAGKDKDVSDVENKRVVDTTARHVEKIKDVAIDQPIRDIGKCPAHQKTATHLGPKRLI